VQAQLHTPPFGGFATHCPVLLQVSWELPKHWVAPAAQGPPAQGPHWDPDPTAMHCWIPHVEGEGFDSSHVLDPETMQYWTSPTTQVHPAVPEAG
jgi:hypothetical protein